MGTQGEVSKRCVEKKFIFYFFESKQRIY